MPINNKLPNKVFPMEWHTGEEPTTTFMSHLKAINVRLLDYQYWNSLKSYLPEWSAATWEDRPGFQIPPDKRVSIVKKVFRMEVLPSALETVQYVFQLSNLDYVDVTHLLRHRTMSFSAHCTGDRDQRHDRALVKPSIRGSKYYKRYRELVHQSKQLYADMLDDGISVLDARTVLPRCLENHYYCRVNLKDFIYFLRQRLDRQIQPESDNILAMKMFIAVAKVHPEIKHAVDLDAPDQWYVKTAQTNHSSNLYMPEKPRNDVFEYKEQWFVYPCERKDMPGGYEFWEYWQQLRKELDKA